MAGDFNIDLIKYDSTACVSEFYDQISSFGFRPLILQPTRLSSSSATLIDNIFINDLSCFSNGGNINTSIFDHLVQFTQLDILENLNKKTTKKMSRNWRVFNRQEFHEEFSQIPWHETIDPTMDSNQSCSKLFDTVNHLLDEMAPMKTLTNKQIKLTQKPWITHEILAQMQKRNIFYKDFCKEKNVIKKTRLNLLFKNYRNKVVSMIRTSRRKYYFDFFLEHQTNVKKTWAGIRNILNVSKK